MNEGYDGPSTSTSPPSGSDRPSKSDDDVVDVDTNVKEASNDIAYDGDLEKGEGNSRVCYVCRIVCVLACIAISVFMIVWFSAIEGKLLNLIPRSYRRDRCQTDKRPNKD